MNPCPACGRDRTGLDPWERCDYCSQPTTTNVTAWVGTHIGSGATSAPKIGVVAGPLSSPVEVPMRKPKPPLVRSRPEAVERIREFTKQDRRYPAAAYEMLMDSMQRATHGAGSGATHITAEDVCGHYVREAVDDFGYLAGAVLADFGTLTPMHLWDMILLLEQNGCVKFTMPDADERAEYKAIRCRPFPYLAVDVFEVMLSADPPLIAAKEAK